MVRRLLFAISVCIGFCIPATALALPANFQETQYGSGLVLPTAMDFAPDGRLFITEKDGDVKIMKDGDVVSTFLSVNVNEDAERGLLGVALDPSFSKNRYVYVYYTRASKPIKNRVSRFTASRANPNKAESGSERILLDDIASDAGIHNAGALHFGKDGKLYISVGDGGKNSDNAQKLSTLSGKILRINKDGSIPSDNPFVGRSGAKGAIWAYGFRNPFSFDVDPVNGRVFANDVGLGAYEEVNHVQAGRNYGWPTCEGSCRARGMTNPIHTYAHGKQAAITGGSFYRKTQFPSSYRGDYFFGDYIKAFLKHIDPVTKKVTTFHGSASSPVDIDDGPDGALYYLSIGKGRVYRIAYNTGNEAPSATFSSSATSGPNPLTISVDASASTDPDGDALTYTWKFGDGSTATGVTASHTYTADGVYDITLTVEDGHGLQATAADEIAVGIPPSVTITSPTEGTTYRGGSVLTFAGNATDPEDGAIAASNLVWTIMFHHSDHVHPFKTVTGKGSGTFTIPRSGETSADVWYRVTLTATDSSGLTASSTRDVLPQTITVNLRTEPAGLQVTFDGVPYSTPAAITAVAGMRRTLGFVADQSVGGVPYDIRRWNHSNEPEHALILPTNSITYTAVYTKANPTMSVVSPTTDGGYRISSGKHATTVKPFTPVTGAFARKITFGTKDTTCYVFIPIRPHPQGALYVYDGYGRKLDTLKPFKDFSTKGLQVTAAIQPVSKDVFVAVSTPGGQNVKVYRVSSAAWELLPNISVGTGGSLAVRFLNVYPAANALVTARNGSRATIRLWKYNRAKGKFERDTSTSTSRITLSGTTLGLR